MKMRKKLKEAIEGKAQEGMDMEEEVEMEMEAQPTEEKKSFGGVAGELQELIHKLNGLPDLLFFIDATADQSVFEDQESLVQQRFINEILNEAKYMKTP